jgi:hypothetical protein
MSPTVGKKLWRTRTAAHKPRRTALWFVKSPRVQFGLAQGIARDGDKSLGKNPGQDPWANGRLRD